MWRGEGLTTVVDFSPGCGSLMLACAKMDVAYVPICMSKTHSAVLLQAATLVGTIESARVLPDSLCVSRRILKREDSNTGRHPAPIVKGKDDDKNQKPDDDDKEDETKSNKPKSDSSDGSGSSSDEEVADTQK